MPRDLKKFEDLLIKLQPWLTFLGTTFVLVCITFCKSEQKVIGNWFCQPIIFNKSLKNSFSIRNILLQFVSGPFGLYFLIEKHAFNGLLKVIGLYRILMTL